MRLRAYARSLTACIDAAELSDLDGRRVTDGIEVICKLIKEQRGGRRKVFVIGNGGSAAIASHVAIDLSKNAGVPSLALNDASALTCLSNDFGYQRVFAEQIEYYCDNKDVLLAISSSGESPSIINGVDAARRKDMLVITFSGFKPDNRLRKIGNYNYYVPSAEYGFVELGHMIILHTVIDYLVAERKFLEVAK